MRKTTEQDDQQILDAARLIISDRNDEIDNRLIRLEQAIIQINHFTETIEKLDLPRWMGSMEGQMTWIKVLIGATAVAALGQLVVTLVKGATGG